MGADYIILYYNDTADFYVCKRTEPKAGERQFFSAHTVQGAVAILAEWDGGNTYKP